MLNPFFNIILVDFNYVRKGEFFMFDNRIRKHLSSFRVITIGFGGLIILGALLLMLPVSSASGCVTPFGDALFTSTSAVCVTGLVVLDTGSYWSSFGQLVIITLIQIGGLGVITVAIAFSLLSGKKVSLMQRSFMQESVSAPVVGGVVRLTGFILKGTFIIELSGALLMMPVFCRDYGLKGIWFAIFHSISAFCNAGFDVLGTADNQFASMTTYACNPVINITLMLLIVIGGIGFVTWEDIKNNKYHFKRYKMQSKLIIVTTAVLITVPAIIFMINDMMTGNEKMPVFKALFQSVTLRTAGFNTVDLNAMKQASVMIMIVLMLIGGSPGSTAGGMKTTTFAVLMGNMVATFKRNKNIHFFERRIDNDTVKNAATIAMMYITLFVTGAFIINVTDGISIGKCLFETASAVGTVGLTLGITPQLGILSRIVLIILMFMGRVGGLTLIYAAFSGNGNSYSKFPEEKINIG